MASRKKAKFKTPEALAETNAIVAPEITGTAVEVEESAEKPFARFPIVGIGASAGGLAAFEAFFSGMPADTGGLGKFTAGPGMAFVLVQHLAPDHESILAELIRRYTRMQVFEVEDGMVVRPNCAYIIPPNCDMAFLNGALQLMEPASPRGQRLPIDFFFRSLAQDQHEHAIGIVLSGTGSDGTLGVRAIKGEGGMVMVQIPASTEYDGMPRSAIATGLVDYELHPSDMPAQLIAYAAHALGALSRAAVTAAPKTENALKKIFILLRNQTGHDFSQYKPSTIHQRIERRMAVHQIGTFEGYVRFLQQTPTEVEALFRDMLIGVTNFFRDPEAFKVLEEEVIPKLFAGKPASAVIRVWSAGCSTGEEAYSLAILLAERQEAMKQSFKVQIFSTDIDSLAIATARAGLYPASVAADISRERLARFFTSDSGGYRIHKGIRDMLVFSEQDLIKDPPFSKLELISCRNLLIYMNGDLQRKLIPLFHCALNTDGVLFLGNSETTGEFVDLFAPIERKLKIYRRREYIRTAPHVAKARYIPPVTAIGVAFPAAAGKKAFPVKLPIRELAERMLLQQFVPSAALVNAHGAIIYLHGRTGMYLEPAPGEAELNILKMAREGLRFELSTALHKAALSREIVRCPGLRVKTNGHFTGVNLTVSPVMSDPSSTPESLLYLVILEDVPEPVISDQSSVISDQLSDGSKPTSEYQRPTTNDQRPTTDARIAVLERELRVKDEYIQSTHEQLETSNEELKSSNEEMQSVNEEMHSTNEELETSKEELQSVNEELSTVNNELQSKVTDLSRSNDDMNNLLAGTGVATVFVDLKQRILRFTPGAMQIINLILTDIGRPLGHILSNLLGYDRLVQDIQGVLDTLVSKEKEVQAKDGKWYNMRVTPYRTLNNVIEGAVITFADITEIKKTQVALDVISARFKTMFNEAPLGIALIDSLTGRFHEVNLMFAKIAGRTMGEMVQIDWMGITHPDDVQKDLDNMALLNAGKIDGFQMEKRYLHHDGTVVWINMTVAKFKGEDKTHPRHLCMIEDITGRKETEDVLRKANDLLRLAVVVRDSHDAVTMQDLEGRILSWNPAAERIYGWSETEALKMNIRDTIAENLREEALDKIRQLVKSDVLEPYCVKRITKDGRTVDVLLTATALLDKSGKIYAIATTEREIGECGSA
jgi:two-component system CheB/CheR fusion protein